MLTEPYNLACISLAFRSVCIDLQSWTQDTDNSFTTGAMSNYKLLTLKIWHFQFVEPTSLENLIQVWRCVENCALVCVTERWILKALHGWRFHILFAVCTYQHMKWVTSYIFTKFVVNKNIFVIKNQIIKKSIIWIMLCVNERCIMTSS
jgi:hypothetical protein